MATGCSEGTGEEGEAALYIKKWIDSEELSLKNSHKQTESLGKKWVIDSPTKGYGILDLLVNNASELISDVKIGAAWAAVIMHWCSLES
ncbi:hypothetical protein llap_3754 [Limosa lapponica baueri]|uniref:Uncharacterized protein n=1 Tax=Limosa lapponica baueri TaxID=1758121 RepID=A0A2I0UIS7_LIMLA|nr:hypothetical protein llap_3754 [Limosa lapponica baueri]